MSKPKPEGNENNEEKGEGIPDKLDAFLRLGRRLFEVPPNELRKMEKDWRERHDTPSDQE